MYRDSLTSQRGQLGAADRPKALVGAPHGGDRPLTWPHRGNLERLVGQTDAIEVLGKPFDLNQVVEAVNRAVERQRSPGGGPPREPGRPPAR